MVSEPGSVLMDAEFRNGVYKILARHESSLDQIIATLQTLRTDLQAWRVTQFQKPVDGEINPFAPGESAHPPNQSNTSCSNTTVGLLGPPPNQNSTPSSKTTQVSFRRIIGQEDSERSEKGEPNFFATLEDLPNESAFTETIPEISFHVMVGTNHHRTIRVVGKLKNKGRYNSQGKVSFEDATWEIQ